MAQCPFHPNPHKNKATLFTTFLLKRRSWLDGLYERSYKMKMRHLRPVPLVSSQKGRKNERRICITRM